MRSKELRNMGKADREKKLKELRLELVKSRVSAAKTGSSKTKQAKRLIARILTLNKTSKEELKK